MCVSAGKGESETERAMKAKGELETKRMIKAEKEKQKASSAKRLLTEKHISMAIQLPAVRIYQMHQGQSEEDQVAKDSYYLISVVLKPLSPRTT